MNVALLEIGALESSMTTRRVCETCLTACEMTLASEGVSSDTVITVGLDLEAWLCGVDNRLMAGELGPLLAVLPVDVGLATAPHLGEVPAVVFDPRS